MIYTCIYAALVVLMLLYCIMKKKSMLAVLLAGYYAVIAILTVFAGKQGVVEVDRVTMFPYLFLVISYTIFFFPFMQNKKVININKVGVYEEEKYKVFCYGYILCSLVTIICYIQPLSNLITSGNWAIQRDMLYGKYTEEIVYPYSNKFEYLCMLITIYFFLLALLISFIMIKNEVNVKLAYTLLVTTVLANVVGSLYTSSRGNIFNLALLVLAMFGFFYRNISKRKRRFITLSVIIGIIAVSPYLIAITISRFSTSATLEIYRYFGEAPAVFNFGVATADKCALGKYCFSELFNTSYSQSDIGATYGSRFYTFVGYIYIDWGYLGVVIVGVICLLFFYRIVTKKQYRISDMYILLYYYQTLLKGGLVIGVTFFKGTIATIAIYLFIRYGMEQMNIRLPRIKFVNLNLKKSKSKI